METGNFAPVTGKSDPAARLDRGPRGVVWRLPAYNIVHNILTNPIYAGAYAFGRTTSEVSIEQGRKRVRRGVHRPMAEWDVLIKDHHEAYITWEEFERNQRVIANNATGKGSARVKGAVRRGELLLPGLLRCGHCGRKLHVSYSGKLGRYNCYGARTNHGAAIIRYLAIIDKLSFTQLIRFRRNAYQSAN